MTVMINPLTLEDNAYIKAYLSRLNETLLELCHLVDQMLCYTSYTFKARDRYWQGKLGHLQSQVASRNELLEKLVRDSHFQSEQYRWQIQNIIGVSSDLKRMAHYAAQAGSRGEHHPDFLSSRTAIRMVQVTRDILNHAIGAFLRSDTRTALEVNILEKEIEALYHQIQKNLTASIEHSPENVNPALEFMWICHQIRRAADCALAICDRVEVIGPEEIEPGWLSAVS